MDGAISLLKVVNVMVCCFIYQVGLVAKVMGKREFPSIFLVAIPSEKINSQCTQIERTVDSKVSE